MQMTSLTGIQQLALLCQCTSDTTRKEALDTLSSSYFSHARTHARVYSRESSNGVAVMFWNRH